MYRTSYTLVVRLGESRLAWGSVGFGVCGWGVKVGDSRFGSRSEYSGGRSRSVFKNNQSDITDSMTYHHLLVAVALTWVGDGACRWNEASRRCLRSRLHKVKDVLSNLIVWHLILGRAAASSTTHRLTTDHRQQQRNDALEKTNSQQHAQWDHLQHHKCQHESTTHWRLKVRRVWTCNVHWSSSFNPELE